ncbi:MAG TPA: sigma-70 family RNA polymerase sigma factor [Acidimicrobiia bacterium]|nr:sigma-70 family RNA polymerase sigma factor [Acidimicrobiia bacterium]
MRIDDPRKASDAALAIGIARWHDGALEEAYRRHGGAVFALAKRVIRDAALAEEVTQEVFVWLWNRPDAFDPARGSLRSFLLALTHRRSVDVVRSEEARRRRESRDVQRERAPDADLDRELVDLTMAEQVRDALGALPDREREPIELAYFGGRTYRQVAAELGEAEGTVKSRIRSGLTSLRAALRDVGVER